MVAAGLADAQRSYVSFDASIQPHRQKRDEQRGSPRRFSH
jgi:hypothetical protein